MWKFYTAKQLNLSNFINCKNMTLIRFIFNALRNVNQMQLLQFYFIVYVIFSQYIAFLIQATENAVNSNINCVSANRGEQKAVTVVCFIHGHVSLSSKSRSSLSRPRYICAPLWLQVAPYHAAAAVDTDATGHLLHKLPAY